ncbi:MAG TPA: hypothetical protein VM386_05935, partial [Acidimicrobiales bacterium]|nr:hypothetical protein [Acidimicrobiales bacterium]
MADRKTADGKPVLTRRRVLQLGGTAGLVAAATWQAGIVPWADREGPPPPSPVATTVRSRRAGRWSDPGTWGGRVPGVADLAVVSTPVVLD